MLQQIVDISQTLDYALVFKTLYLFTFFSFLRLSNILPHSAYQFDPTRHLTRGDIIFSGDIIYISPCSLGFGGYLCFTYISIHSILHSYVTKAMQRLDYILYQYIMNSVTLAFKWLCCHPLLFLGCVSIKSLNLYNYCILGPIDYLLPWFCVG